MPIEPERLQALIHKAARRAFDQVRRAHGDETFYAFALYTDDGYMTVMPSANSEEACARTLASYGVQDKPPREQAQFRWSTAEWGYEGQGADEFDEVYDLVNGDERDAGETDQAWHDFGDKIIDAMVGALRALDAEGYFGTGAARERVTLFVSISDSDDADAIENASAKKLNPPAVAARFLARFDDVA